MGGPEAPPPPSPPQAMAGLPQTQHPHLADQQGGGWSWAPGGSVLHPAAGGCLPGQGPWGGAPCLRHRRLFSHELFRKQQGRDPSGRLEPMGMGKPQPRPRRERTGVPSLLLLSHCYPLSAWSLLPVVSGLLPGRRRRGPGLRASFSRDAVPAASPLGTCCGALLAEWAQGSVLLGAVGPQSSPRPASPTLRPSGS